VAANILVTFTADSDSLDASVKQATKDIASIGDKAAQAGAKASESFKEAGKSAAAAFSSGQVKAAIDSQVKSIDSLRAGIDKLYKEEIKLLSAGQKQSSAYKKNVEEAAKLRAEIEKLSKGTNVYGNETGKVEKAAVSLKTQLKNLKAELSNLEAQGQENSKAFQDTAFQAARLEDQIGDTNERVRVLASDTFKFDAAVGAIKGLAAGFSIAQGAVAIFGEENKDLQKVIAQTQGAIALLTGLQEAAALVTGQGATKIAFQNIFMKEKVVVTTAAATATGALATAEEGAAVATLTTVRSLNLLKLAIAGTGIGLLVIGLVALYKAWEESQQAALNAKKAYEEVGVSVRNLRQDNFELQKSLIDSADALAVAQGREKQSAVDIRNERRDALEEGIKANGEYLLQIQQLKIREQELAKVVARSRNGTDFQDKKNRADLEANVKRRIELEKLVAEDIATRRLILSNKVQTIEQEELNSSKKNGEAKVEVAKETAKSSEQVALELAAKIASIDKIYASNRLQLDKSSIASQKSVLQAELQETTAALNLDLFTRKKAGEDIITLTEEIKQKQLKANQDYADGVKAIDETIVENEFKNLSESEANIAKWIDYRKKVKKKQADDEKKADDEETERIKAENQKRADTFFQYADAVASAFASINDLSKQLSENRIADITASSDAELEAINNSTDTERKKDRERTALAKRTAAAIAAEKTKVAKQDKALALFDIALTTAKAAFAAAVGPPPNPILAGIIIASGAIQLAAVAAKPIPKFERGGVIGGQRHSQGGTMIEAERDEYIVNRGQSVKHRQELNAMNTSSAAFKKLIDERYVRPAVMSYMMQDKRRSDGVTVNAKLDSRSMESELRSINKNLKKRPMVINVNSNDSRYQWQ
jgi:hypothetical protein